MTDERDLLVISIGGAGDTYPMLALALRLRDRGRRVRFIGNARFAPLAADMGLEFIPYVHGSPVAESSAGPRWIRLSWMYQSLARSRRRTRSYIGAMRWLYERIASENPRRTAVVARANAFGARLAQEKLGFLLAGVQLQPAAFRSIYDAPGLPLPRFAGGGVRRVMWSAIDASIGCTITPELNRFRSELGLAPVRRPLRGWIHSPDLVIGLFPEWFGPPQPDWPPNTALAGFSLFDESGFRRPPSELEKFLAAGAPPIVFTRGSHSRQAEARAFFETSVEIALRMDRRAVLLARERDPIPRTLPEGAAFFGYVPLSRILPRAAAIVHHGGAGTAAHAFAAGIPQMAVPLADDQPDNAARIERLGAGVRLSPRRYRAESAAAELKRLLDSPQVAATCRRLAAAVAARDSLGLACEAIDAMLSREPALSPKAASTHAGSRPVRRP